VNHWRTGGVNWLDFTFTCAAAGVEDVVIELGGTKKGLYDHDTTTSTVVITGEVNTISRV